MIRMVVTPATPATCWSAATAACCGLARRPYVPQSCSTNPERSSIPRSATGSPPLQVGLHSLTTAPSAAHCYFRKLLPVLQHRFDRAPSLLAA